ncbi:MAG TPA: quinol:electron acceptor oxidoreductase subunit ActD [Myxococcales bacterium]|jgi:hypothetical protein
MPLEPGVLASFADPASAARAIRALRQGGVEDVRVAMPAHYPAVMEALGRPRSLLGWVTFPGAILGLLCGLGLTIGTSLAWPLVTGGKPIVSLPPFVIVTFEVTVLVGAVTNLVALFVGSALGERRRAFPRGSRFTGELIGVFAAGEPEAAERLLREAGAREVTRVGG